MVEAHRGERFSIEKEGDVYLVKGKEVEKHAAMSYLDTDGGLRRFQNILKAMGVEQALRDNGVHEGDKVMIGKLELEWTEGG